MLVYKPLLLSAYSEMIYIYIYKGLKAFTVFLLIGDLTGHNSSWSVKYHTTSDFSCEMCLVSHGQTLVCAGVLSLAV